MSALIEWLEKIANEDSKVRAVLKKSLSSDLGMCIDAFPYIERFLNQSTNNEWGRKVHYLVAGLWALHWKKDQSEEKMTIAKACAKYMNESDSTSTEKRFISTIDSDQSQLPYRLRQLVMLLKDEPIDFSNLLTDLLNWKNEKKFVQIRWAQDFYYTLNQNSKKKTK